MKSTVRSCLVERVAFEVAFWKLDLPVIDKGGETMKIVVIGGTGLIDSKSGPVVLEEVLSHGPITGHLFAHLRDLAR